MKKNNIQKSEWVRPMVKVIDTKKNTFTAVKGTGTPEGGTAGQKS